MEGANGERFQRSIADSANIPEYFYRPNAVLVERVLIMLWFFMVPWVVALAQGEWRGPTIYPEKLKHDLEVFRSALHRAHPDPYRYRSGRAIDSAFDRARDSLVVPMDTEAFMALLLDALRGIGDAGLCMERSAQPEQAFARATRILPVRVRIIEGSVYLDEEMKGFRSLPVGSRMISVNGVPISTVLERTRAFLIGEGDNTTHIDMLLEQQFPWLLVRAFGERSSYRIGFETEGKRRDEVVFAMTGDEVARTERPSSTLLQPWHYTWDAASRTMWVRLSDMRVEVLARYGQDPAGFIDHLLRELKQSTTYAVVLDVRGAVGSDVDIVEEVFSAVATAPFRVFRSISMRSGIPADDRPWIELPEELYASADGKNIQEPPVLTDLLDTNSEPVQPHPKAFAGKVYVVCDGGTRGTAAALVMLAKRTRRARIVGEETGSNAASFTAGKEARVVAPNSGTVLHIPLVKYVPDGELEGAPDRGEIPHHVVHQAPADIARGRDTVKASLLELIKELQ